MAVVRSPTAKIFQHILYTAFKGRSVFKKTFPPFQCKKKSGLQNGIIIVIIIVIITQVILLLLIIMTIKMPVSL